ncbi:MAG: DUF134 domain-containing protein [Clostridiales bacterium]|nr:DUF134 domain-containing protein [Clostridiales bacterium]
MPRPKRCRRVCSEPAYDRFAPSEIFCGERVILSVDEYEIIRLIDLNSLTHEQCAAMMDVSRTTVTEMYESARHKLADCLVNGKELKIAGGSYRLCDGSAVCFCGKCKKFSKPGQMSEGIKQKGDSELRIAATYENGEIFQHFGHTEEFIIYDIENDSVVSEQVVSAEGFGHGALADFLKNLKTDVLICGGIGRGAVSALEEAGITVCGGVSGACGEAVSKYLSGSLSFSADANCDHDRHHSEHHHHHHGQHGEHHGRCGEHGCHGKGGNCHE